MQIVGTSNAALVCSRASQPILNVIGHPVDSSSVLSPWLCISGHLADNASSNGISDMKEFKTWAFRRPFCSPSTGTLQAKTGKEALKLVHYMYGFASDTEVYCMETEEKHKDT